MDHIQLRSQDPGYFLDRVLEYSEHLPGQVLDVEGNPVSSLNSQDFWELVIRNVLAEAYAFVISWDLLSKQATKLADFQDKYAHMLSPWKKLDDFMMEFLVFWHALEKQSEAPTVVCAISPFSPFVLSLNSLYLAPKCLSSLEAFRVAFHLHNFYS